MATPATEIVILSLAALAYFALIFVVWLSEPNVATVVLGIGALLFGALIYVAWTSTPTTAIVILGASLYLVCWLLVRWNLIARPTRELARAQIEAVKARLECGCTDASQRKSRIDTLLTGAGTLLDDNQVKAIDRVFWSRGHEIAAWERIHEAERLLIDCLSDDELIARLRTAANNLRPAAGQDASAKELYDAIIAVIPKAEGENRRPL